MRIRRIGCLLLVFLLAFAVSAQAHTVNTPRPIPIYTPAPTPVPTPTPEPTEEPTPEPTVEPTSEPTAEPTAEPAPAPSGEPAEEPSAEPAETAGPDGTQPADLTDEQPSTRTDLQPATPTDQEPKEPSWLHPELLYLHQINIGCADAYLMTIGDIVILVDCGTDSTVPISRGVRNVPLFDYLAAVGIDHIDYHFVTHWHNDHDYNVNSLGRLYGTDDTIVYGNSATLYNELDPLAKGTYKQLVEGDRLTIGELDVLCVGPEWFDKIPGDRNKDSLNFIVTYKNVRIMFTGDFIQDSLRKRWPEEIKDIDVFSFPHHGIRLHEQSAKVYNIIDPRLVLIPGNERGTVRSYAIHDAGAAGCEDAVYLCARDGNILVTSDGFNIWYATEVEPGDLPLGEALPPRTWDTD